jgi:transketolase C-terminal domain/subunit
VSPHSAPQSEAVRPGDLDEDVAGEQGGTAVAGDGTGHPAVDAVLRSLANAAQLAPADQIAEYEAAHRVLQETLSSIDG